MMHDNRDDKNPARTEKVGKSIRRCQDDRNAEGYERCIDENRGPIAKNGVSAEIWISGAKKAQFLPPCSSHDHAMLSKEKSIYI